MSSGPINIAELPYRGYGPSVTRPPRNRSHANSAVQDYVIIVYSHSSTNLQPKSPSDIFSHSFIKRDKESRVLFSISSSFISSSTSHLVSQSMAKVIVGTKMLLSVDLTFVSSWRRIVRIERCTLCPSGRRKCPRPRQKSVLRYLSSFSTDY